MTPSKDYLRVNGFSGLLSAGVVVLIANALFFLAVFTVDAVIDHKRLFDRVAEAAAANAITDQDYPPELATYADRFTDCVGVSLNLGGRPDRSARELFRDMEVPRVEGLGACPALIRMLNDKSSVTLASYSRYWHGYQIFSKPFLYLGSIGSLRYIFASLVIIAVTLFSLNISTALTSVDGALIGVWFAAGFILLTDGADLANVFTHSISLLSIFSVAALMFWALRAGHRRYLFLMAVAAGCVVSFFDLLFNPPLALSALIVGAAAALNSDELSARDVIRLALIIAFGWAIGFFGTYVCRFALAVALSDTPRETLQEIYTAGLFRISGTEYKIRQIVGWATVQNFGYPMLRPSFAVFVLFTGILAATLWRRHRHITVRPAYLALLLPTPICVLWFEALRNHSQHHHWFTYRSASFALVCFAATVLFSLSTPSNSLAAPVDRSI
jgi:hypothetical protein